jgi:hypothetical protein
MAEQHRRNKARARGTRSDWKQWSLTWMYVVVSVSSPVSAWVTLRTHRTHDLKLSAAHSMSTCLVIVPPDQSWDRLQRARHFARDRSYTKWPPCIRLLHPFVSESEMDDYALRIADIIEEYNIQPLSLRLDQWSLVPHVEAMEADWEAMRNLPDSTASTVQSRTTNSDKEIQELIAREEKIGKEKLKERRRRDGAKQKNRNRKAEQVPQNSSGATAVPAPGDEDSDDNASSKNALLQKQKQMYEEFNGPTVICLEPDAESVVKLTALRELLLHELFPDADQRLFMQKYSVSSSVSDPVSFPLYSKFRPVVPIAAFPTVTSAMEMARKLRKQWEPLEFDVTDLHVISSSHTADSGDADHLLSDNREYQLFHSPKTTSSSLGGGEERHLTTAGQFGCDSMIMLMGEEVEMDELLNQDIAKMVLERGETGGYGADKIVLDNSHDNTSTDKDEEDLGILGDLKQWLEEDDDFDEGTVVVIRRTHFFTGEMRNYVGMPAFSVMVGTVLQSIAADRRKLTALRSDGNRTARTGCWAIVSRERREDEELCIARLNEETGEEMTKTIFLEQTRKKLE